VTSEDRESTQWKIYGERLVDENPFIRLNQVELVVLIGHWFVSEN